MYKRLLTISIIFIVLLSLIPISILISNEARQELQVQNGVMDLAAWNPEQDGRIKLDGEWEFYWNELLPPSFFRQDSSDAASRMIMKVPSDWTQSRINGKPLPAHGYATYRMVLSNVPDHMVFALKKTNIRFSSDIYINGERLLSDGNPSDRNTDYTAGNIPQMGGFPSTGDDIEIIVHVANYDYINAGIPASIYFGELNHMTKHQQQLIVREFSLIAILVTLAVIYAVCFIAAWLNGKKDYSLLLFSLICLLFSIYQGLVGERVLLLFGSSFSFEWIYKIKDISSITYFIVLALLFNQLQQNIISRRATKITITVLSIFTLLIVLLPIQSYTLIQVYVIVFYELLLLWMLVRAGGLYVKSTTNQRINSLLLFLGMLTINLYSLDLLLFAFSLKEEIWLGQLYIVIFNIIMIFLVVLRFFTAYQKMKEMKNKLVRLDKIKDDFLINTSHELKTPLGAIVGITDSIIQRVEGPLNEQQIQNLTIVKNSGRRLTMLVNELLDYSKMKNGDITIYKKRMNLKASVDAVIKVQMFILGNKPVRLINSISEAFPDIYADPDRLLQILHNLIGNAIKYTDLGEVEISAGMNRNTVVIHVRDTGIGIAPDMEEVIFQAYEQIESSSKYDRSGIGIGLNITRKLVELHGGQIQVESAIGEGSVFTFTLPQLGMDSAERDTASKEHHVEANESLNLQVQYPLYLEGKIKEPILVVEDDLANMQSIINALKLKGYSIVAVNNGHQALQELDKNQDFYLVILDIMMADMSGYEVLTKIRERYTLFELPVLMLTARNKADDMRVAVDNGANDYVGKPFETEELLARVNNLTKMKAAVKHAKDAEIAFLRSQIKPHFLYNALNSIAELCIVEPSQAEDLVLHLSSYLRNSFDFKQLDSFTTLEKELALVEAYVHIEKARFGSRIQVEYDIDADPFIQIPPLSLQPLVENAIRHGLMSNSNGGIVNVVVRKQEDYMMSFSVSDNGCGMSEKKLKEILSPQTETKGVGLWNIGQRIKLLYGIDFEVTSVEGVGTRIMFQIPAHPEYMKRSN
ncbi:ATP-binding protein [Paenibacillus sp. 453mf]|uniref:sensor histidine kinase n=1 Tax=Paenibacillus sp. 453mf TaxID=1761874 RepID=UPI0008F4336F|nr:ATP-binding protein [Paenibacillus sp. 453mf]SFS61911.1 Histidine kinase-, DNA gyrase B-, and HSP90-like ATPase [Paenibacillus sp. 453mf]